MGNLMTGFLFVCLSVSFICLCFGVIGDLQES